MTDLTKLRAELRAGLDGVTPGPWDRNNVDFVPHVVIARQKITFGSYADAAHIARCSPENIRALLDALDAAVKVADEQCAYNSRAVARADAVERERDEARRERDEARLHVEMLQEKIDADESCACSYDTVHDVCLSHSPKLAKAEADLAKAEALAVRMERERDEARAALYCRVSSKVFCAMLSTGVCDKIDKSDHEAALTRARIEGRIEALEEAATIADKFHADALKWAANFRGLSMFLDETDSSRIAAAIRALKDRAP